MSFLLPDRRRREKNKRRRLFALALSLAFHFVLVGFVWLSAFFEWKFPPRPAPLAQKPPSFNFRPLTAEQWAQNRGEPSAAPRPEPKPKVQEVPKGQVVDVAPGNGQEDANAKYLAEKSNKVQKETRAKEQTPFYRNAMPQRTAPTAQPHAGKDAVDLPQIAGNRGDGNDERPKKNADRKNSGIEIPSVKAQSEVAMRPTEGPGAGVVVENRKETAGVDGNSRRFRLLPGGEMSPNENSDGKSGLPGVVNLLPSFAVVDKIMGAAPNDHLRDVAEGDGTYLNTREFKYASFFNRVKQNVSMHWNPTEPLRLRDPTGEVYGSRDRYTLLSVTLSQDGRVKDIFVEKSSGLDFLDAEAIRSFERAQPFPNPPPGLLAEDSQVKFSFGFFLDMGGPRMRLFRQAN